MRTLQRSRFLLLLLALSCLMCLATAGYGQILSTQTGVVSFTSDAPLETIRAQSNQMAAAINTANNTFAFSIRVPAFQGFNSALQRQHFNENYMESQKFPYGIFKGKIIESVNLNTNGVYNVRAKGELMIHGVAQERIINANIVVQGGQIRVTSTFTVPIKDHNILIPNIVFQKIAENIFINVNATLVKR